MFIPAIAARPLIPPPSLDLESDKIGLRIIEEVYSAGVVIAKKKAILIKIKVAFIIVIRPPQIVLARAIRSILSSYLCLFTKYLFF